MPRSAREPPRKPLAWEVRRSWRGEGGEAAALGIINEQRVMGKARIN